MYASLLLSSFLMPAAPVPEFKLTPEEEEALKALEPFGINAIEDRTNKRPYGTILQYNSNLGYDRAQGKVTRAAVPTQRDLAPLAKLRRTQQLIFQGVPGGDATLDLLRGMDRLEYLDVRFSTVTDEGVKNLGGLKRLYTLNLNDTTVTDASLKVLAKHPAITDLHLNNTAVTDEGLKALATNERLRVLYLGGKKGITDAGLVSLAEMPNLVCLALGGTGLTDKGLAQMAKPGTFPKLLSLMLAGTAVTDKGLKVLHNPEALPALRRINLPKAGVTDEGVKALKKMRPELKIDVR